MRIGAQQAEEATVNREDIQIGQLLGQVMTCIRTKDYEGAVEPLLTLRRFVILQPLQVTDGERLAMQNMENSVSAAILCKQCQAVSSCGAESVLACYGARIN